MDGGELRARCPACDQVSLASVAGSRNHAAPRDHAGGTECPKCGHRAVTGEACPRCGLSRARMAAWSEDTTVTPTLLAAWEACLADWNNPDLHDRAASLSLTVTEQPWLARRYRAVLRDRPDDAIATARLARVGKIAQAAVLATASTPSVSRFRRGSSAAMLLVMVALVVAGIVFVLYLVRENDDDSRARPRTQPATPRSSVEPWQRSELRGPPP